MGLYHVCHICKKSFTDRSNMNAHMKIHTSDRPYACDLCGKTFKRKYDVTKHKREQKYPCRKKSQVKKIITLEEEKHLQTEFEAQPDSDIEEVTDNYDIKANMIPKTSDNSPMANEEIIRNNYVNNLRWYCFLTHIFQGILQSPNENP